MSEQCKPVTHTNNTVQPKHTTEPSLHPFKTMRFVDLSNGNKQGSYTIVSICLLVIAYYFVYILYLNLHTTPFIKKITIKASNRKIVMLRNFIGNQLKIVDLKNIISMIINNGHSAQFLILRSGGRALEDHNTLENMSHPAIIDVTSRLVGGAKRVYRVCIPRHRTGHRTINRQCTGRILM